MKRETGIVGYFDILGYKSLLEHNEPEIIADRIFPIFRDIRHNLVPSLRRLFPNSLNAKPSLIDATIESIKTIIYSDTILLTTACLPDNGIPEPFKWTIFFLTAINLETAMFSAGLPVRGVIHYGSYIIEEGFLAGRSLVEAHQLCGSLDMAACILTDEATKQLITNEAKIRQIFNASYFGTFLHSYEVPLKEESRSFNVLIAAIGDWRNSDLRSQIITSFTAYQKTLPASINSNIVNTEQWMRYMQTQHRDKSTLDDQQSPVPHTKLAIRGLGVGEP